MKTRHIKLDIRAQADIQVIKVGQNALQKLKGPLFNRVIYGNRRAAAKGTVEVLLMFTELDFIRREGEGLSIRPARHTWEGRGSNSSFPAFQQPETQLRGDM